MTAPQEPGEVVDGEVLDDAADAREAAYAAEAERLNALGRGRLAVDSARANYRRAVLAARQARAGTMAPLAGVGQLATLDEASGRVDAARAFAALTAVALERVQLYGAQLAAAYAEVGEEALIQTVSIVDPETGELVPNRQQPSALVALELRERDTAERLLTTAAKLGLEQRAVGLREQNAAQTVAFARRLVERLGFDWSDEEVRRGVQAALLEARGDRARVERQGGSK
jgi:hypothetical protein